MIINFLSYTSLFFFIAATRCESKKYVPCASTENEAAGRVLHALTCDSRSGWKEFMALKTWNITSEHLRTTDKLHMINVCTGLNWGKLGFLTKPLTYLGYIKGLMAASPGSVDSMHVILMDSDTFWSTGSLETIWNKFDCARKKKPIVLSTEMSCWVGRYCTADDLKRWYSKPKETPSYSPFVNSGFVMGRAQNVATMLQYVVDHNASYYTTYKKLKFDDQYAIADYGINVAPAEVQLDYHQELSGSFSIHASPEPMDEGWPFACKNKTGEISLSCPIFTNLARKHGHFVLHQDTCLVGRSTRDGMPYQEELESLSPDPLVWHGAGAGKQSYGHFGYLSYRCFITRKNLTDEQYNLEYGYGR